MLWMSVWLVVMNPAWSASAQSENPVDPVKELIDLRAERDELLDIADELTVELNKCSELLEMAEENPPECDGFPWLEVVVSLAVGAAIGAIVD